jgi:hypothetical protein
MRGKTAVNTMARIHTLFFRIFIQFPFLPLRWLDRQNIGGKNHLFRIVRDVPASDDLLALLLLPDGDCLKPQLRQDPFHLPG